MRIATKVVRARGRDSLRRIAADIVGCEQCQRLRNYCREVARTKRRAYRDCDYWGRPVPGFGDPEARLLLVGLAPGAHGSNRTGRMFTGDASGDWLYAAMHRYGFASQPRSESRHDGMRLSGAYISAAARCAPPGNKPESSEIAACIGYLEREFRVLARLAVVLGLGKIGFHAAVSVLATGGFVVPQPRPQFGHCAEYVLSTGEDGSRRVVLLGSYHPSRQNTQTGKLTASMWDDVFRRARALCDART